MENRVAPRAGIKNPHGFPVEEIRLSSGFPHGRRPAGRAIYSHFDIYILFSCHAGKKGNDRNQSAGEQNFGIFPEKWVFPCFPLAWKNEPWRKKCWKTKGFFSPVHKERKFFSLSAPSDGTGPIGSLPPGLRPGRLLPVRKGRRRRRAAKAAQACFWR